MKVFLAEDFGFCFGVKAAIERIEKLLESGTTVVTDGDIVHNKRVMKELVKKGLIVSEDLQKADKAVFAVRAHGISPDKFEEISKKFGENVVDLTCPIVKALFEKAEKCRREGYKVVVFGKDGHAEMLALKGHVQDAVITMEAKRTGFERICVLSQTTSSWREFSEFISDMLCLNFTAKEIKILNTICPVTYGREKEVEKLSESCDLVVVVGGKHSANTGKLFRIAMRKTQAVWIESPSELDGIELGEKGCVAVVSGTSTPEEDVREVFEKLVRRG